MAFLDKVSDIAKSAVDKAGDAVDITKLTAKIKSVESDIKAEKIKIGEAVIEQAAAGAEFDEDITEILNKIDLLKNSIEEMQLEIEQIKAAGKAD